MRVITIVRLAQARVLERALGGMADVVQCSSAAECDRAIAAHRPHALVVDPSLLRDEDLASVVENGRTLGLPIVFYFALDAPTLASVLPILGQPGADLLLANVDDSGDHVREVLGNVPIKRVRGRLFSSLVPTLVKLQTPAAMALTAVLLHPTWRSAKELPGIVGTSRRTIDRMLVRGGCAPLQVWCSASRVTRAFEEMRKGGRSFSHASWSAGYEDVRSCRRAIRSVLGPDYEYSLAQMDDAEFIARAAGALVRVGKRRGHPRR